MKSLDIYGGMTKDRLVLTFVPHHGVDPVTKKLLPYSEDRYAVHGGSVANEKQIRKWAGEQGYKVVVRHGKVEQ